MIVRRNTSSVKASLTRTAVFAEEPAASCPQCVPGSARHRCAGEGHANPGQLGISAFGTPDISVEAQRRRRVSPTRTQAAAGEGAGGTPRTEPLPLGPVDGAAASFALERERVLARSEHSASVRRLRQAVHVGLVVWPATAALDWWVVSFAGASDLGRFLVLRGLGLLAGLLALWRLHRPVEPSPRSLCWIDLGIFTWVSLLVSLMCLSFGGIGSPYAAGLSAILVARGATTLAPWRRGVWLFGIPALSFPITMLVLSPFDARVAEQFADPLYLGLFVTSLVFLVTTWALLTVGGNFAWRLRREALEMRNIGRYRLERQVGRGGMGEVWAAFDRTLKQRVALKTVRGQRPDSSAVERLEREVRALAALSHPNTVRVFDHGVTEDGLWYYAMELLHGANLHELVEREGPLRVPRLLHIARQALRALGEAHDKGIVHRDIKPDNVFVAELGGEADVVKLLDFGIAKALLSNELTLTNPGWCAGTPAYMPPEVIHGKPADIRSDIYSFGATLYFALTARLPFGADSRSALFEAHVNRVPPRLSATSPHPIPHALALIVERCLAKDPNERYPSTQTLLEDLLAVTGETSA
jgi:tRNA A-37 threonylcarbamoyl transferase component Bud32